MGKNTLYSAGLGLIALIAASVLLSEGSKSEMTIFSRTPQGSWLVGDVVGYKTRVFVSISPDSGLLDRIGITKYIISSTVGGDISYAHELPQLRSQEIARLEQISEAKITSEELFGALSGNGEIWKYDVFRQLALIAFIPAAIGSSVCAWQAFLASKRAKENCCVRCGYPAGSDRTNCPECGSPVP